jgi:hypothetical protein
MKLVMLWSGRGSWRSRGEESDARGPRSGPSREREARSGERERIVSKGRRGRPVQRNIYRDIW